MTSSRHAAWQAFADLLPTPVYLPEHGPVRDSLVSASQRAALAGHPVTAILLTNPNNPLVRAERAPSRLPIAGGVCPKGVRSAWLSCWCHRSGQMFLRASQGTVYPRELLEEVINWCIAAKVHLICDEVRRQPTTINCFS